MRWAASTTGQCSTNEFGKRFLTYFIIAYDSLFKRQPQEETKGPPNEEKKEKATEEEKEKIKKPDKSLLLQQFQKDAEATVAT